MATQTFREKKTTTKSTFFGLSFNVYSDVDKRERARARDKKVDEFCSKNNIKILYRRLKKWEMLAVSKEKPAR